MKKKPTLKVSTHNSIDLNDWDTFVETVYGKIYSFQQQEGCRSRGVYNFTVPCDIDPCIDEDETTLEEWLEIPNDFFKFEYDWLVKLHWEREFYPPLEQVAQDLYERGLLEQGKYTIIVDW